ncbi:hypothetical protein RFI_25322, partial [Reticulomyxa filosa]
IKTTRCCCCICYSEHLPQKFHLTTKESFRCPYKHCSSYVCKPTLSGRGANFDIRTAVLDYLPRVTLEVISGGLVSNVVSKILMRFQNRHMEEAQIQIDTVIAESDTNFNGKDEDEEEEDLNDDDDDDEKKDNEQGHDQPLFDPFIECSKEVITIDPMDIHTKKGVEIRDKTFPNGDFVKGKEAGIHLSFKPKYYEPADIKFTLRVNFSTKLASTDESKTPSPLQEVHLSYLLDFFLGQSIKPGNTNPAPIAEAENNEEGDPTKRHFPRMETTAQLFDDGATKGNYSVPASPRPEITSEEHGTMDHDLDLDGRLDGETKARGSQEYKKPPTQ